MNQILVWVVCLVYQRLDVICFVLCCDIFNHIFPTHSQQHSFKTRYAAAFCLPQCRTNIKQFSVLYQGPKLYNSLDAKITSSSSLSSFKKKLKGSIIQNY